MSPSEKIDDYARGWSGLMKLVRNGHSWSGSERNRFFLNGGQEKFHEMSHLAGLDQIEDGRGLALVDWDHDGRLDLWYRNRSAPRLRLMLNRRECPPSIALKLEGTTSNRDAIGAVVELLPAVTGKRLLRSVKAGDLFPFAIKQMAALRPRRQIKLHPGFRDLAWWQKGIFEGIDTKTDRFSLKQGTGKAIAVAARPAIQLEEKPLAKSSSNEGNARIILPARVPFPSLTFRDQSAKLKTLVRNGKPRLVILWSGTCEHCKSALKELSRNADQIRAAEIDVLALSVDTVPGPAADISPAYDLIDQTKFPFPWGVTDERSARLIHRFQEALFDRTPAASVPLAVLLNPAHQAVAIYRGEFSIAEALQDWRAIGSANEVQLHHFAPPMGGTWFTNPLPQRQVGRMFPAATE